MRTRLPITAIASGLTLICIALTAWQIAAQSTTDKHEVTPLAASDARLWVLRLHPGDDLIDSIQKFASQLSIDAGSIVTCVGSLDHARLRYANQPEYEDLDSKGRHFEIVSLVGTFSTKSHHLHLALANEKGSVFGGHASSGNKVFTTAEIVIAEGLAWEFQRAPDPQTNYMELSPVPRKHFDAVRAR